MDFVNLSAYPSPGLLHEHIEAGHAGDGAEGGVDDLDWVKGEVLVCRQGGAGVDGRRVDAAKIAHHDKVGDEELPGVEAVRLLGLFEENIKDLGWFVPALLRAKKGNFFMFMLWGEANL